MTAPAAEPTAPTLADPGATTGGTRRGWRSAAVDRSTDAAYAAGWWAVRALPEPVARGAFDTGARWAAARDGGGIRQLRANLRVATGGRLSEEELDALTTRAVRSYARYWREAFRLPRMDPASVVAHCSFSGVEHFERARDAGRPLIVALPHSGNWDAAGVWLVDFLGGPFLTVAERLRPESLYRRFLEFRETLGMRVVPLTGGPRPSSVVLRDWVGGGGSVCLVVDRDLGGSGVPVEFFGRPATMPGGAALLAAQTGAALHAAVVQFTEDGWRIVIHPEVPTDGPGRLRDRVGAATQALADAFAVSIAGQPEDWHMLGRIWADVPPDPARPGRRGPRRGRARS